MAAITLERLHSLIDDHVAQLSSVLLDCVDGGASVGFMQPLSLDQAFAFWQRVGAGVLAGERALLVARDEVGIVGTVQLVLDQPANQNHRADLCKMLVHRRGRRQGLGAALMHGAEDMARACNKKLLVLDTATGSEAERLYARLGWERVGVIPNYAHWPDGALCGTTYFYKTMD
ncbi:MAG: GNAT family N-acetyltransferase [Pseudomonadota bacterium]